MIPALIVACVLAANPEAVPAPAAPPPDLAAYKEARANAGRDADAHVRLALWCEARGMVAERTKHLTIATLIDPRHPAARGLLGMIQHQGKWLSPDALAQQLQADPDQQARVKEYLQRRAKAADKPDDQVKLALWCEENGLKDQATAHFYRAVQLDPGRELAWRHLGYKKEKGRWARPEQLAAEREVLDLQAKANKHWRPILEKLRNGLSSKHAAEREKAQAALDGIKDPAAVPMVWATFAQGDARRQAVAVRLLGQIDAPGASRALAMLAIFGQTPEVRRGAIEHLRQRDPRDFVEILVTMIRKPIEYEIRRKAGLNTPGELFVKGAERNLQRFYIPHEMPTFVPQAADTYRYDANGLPVVSRFLSADPILLGWLRANSKNGPLSDAEYDSIRSLARGFLASNSSFAELPSSLSSVMGLAPPLPTTLSSDLTKAGIPANVAETIVKNVNENRSHIATFNPLEAQGGRRYGPIYATTEQRMDIPLGQMIVDAQETARQAEQRLQDDVQQIESYNAPIRNLNRKSRQVLADTVGFDLGDDPVAWDRWTTELFGRLTPVAQSSTQEIPTVTEEITPDQPPASPTFVSKVNSILFIRLYSCFAAGTPVRTIDGNRPIESIRPGDLVLAQDTQTGRIAFRPVVSIFHNPPKETLKVSLEGSDETVLPTGIHRFWKAGEGWVMARDLKPGDVLRTAGGTVAVRSVEADETRPVYNLRVADAADYFVGNLGILAHDNSLPEPVADPFDRIEPKGKELASAERK